MTWKREIKRVLTAVACAALSINAFGACERLERDMAVDRAMFASTPDYPEAEWVGPACEYQPASRGAGDIDMIVIHTCEGGFDGCWSWLQMCHDPSSSAHYVVRSSDGHVVQVVEDDDIAWHATCVNSRSIGIEHEGYAEDPAAWYTEAMYCGSADLVHWLTEQYGIPRDRDHILGHNEVNDLYCGGSHWDPGDGWDWTHYMDLVAGGCSPCSPGETRCSGDGAAVEVCDPGGTHWTARPCRAGCVGGACCGYGAEIIEVHYPSTMTSGELAEAYVEARNSGCRGWDDGTRLAATVDRGRESPFFDSASWIAADRPASVDAPTAAGAAGRFTFLLKAPDATVETRFTEHFGLVQEGVTWFSEDGGPPDDTVVMTITVRPFSGEEAETAEGEQAGEVLTENPDAPESGLDASTDAAGESGQIGIDGLQGGCSCGLIFNAG